MSSFSKGLKRNPGAKFISINREREREITDKLKNTVGENTMRGRGREITERERDLEEKLSIERDYRDRVRVRESTEKLREYAERERERKN